jgi:hypothetical protein
MDFGQKKTWLSASFLAYQPEKLVVSQFFFGFQPEKTWPIKLVAKVGCQPSFSAGNDPRFLDDTPCIFNIKHQCMGPSSGPYQRL